MSVVNGLRLDGFAPISCEPCRQKKCKCNRELPSCSQCNVDPTKCQYSEISKRGIPGGYLGRLENRLADGEWILFCALSKLFERGQDLSFVFDLQDHEHHDCEMTKNEKMKEWGDFPLKSSADAYQWWLFKQEKLLGMNGQRIVTGDDPNNVPVDEEDARAVNGSAATMTEPLLTAQNSSTLEQVSNETGISSTGFNRTSTTPLTQALEHAGMSPSHSFHGRGDFHRQHPTVRGDDAGNGSQRAYEQGGLMEDSAASLAKARWEIYF